MSKKIKMFSKWFVWPLLAAVMVLAPAGTANAAELAKVIDTELDPAKRNQAIIDLQKIWLDDAWCTMLYQQQQITALNKSVKGFVYDASHWAHPEDLYKQ